MQLLRHIWFSVVQVHNLQKQNCKQLLIRCPCTELWQLQALCDATSIRPLLDVIY